MARSVASQGLLSDRPSQAALSAALAWIFSQPMVVAVPVRHTEAVEHQSDNEASVACCDAVIQTGFHVPDVSTTLTATSCKPIISHSPENQHPDSQENTR